MVNRDFWLKQKPAEANFLCLLGRKILLDTQREIRSSGYLLSFNEKAVMKKQWFTGCLFLAISSVASMAQGIPSEQGIDARIDALLRQLTLEEKMNLIRGGRENPATYQGQAGFLPGVPRLHIPTLRFSDGPPGVLTRVPAQGETATMGVAATFSIKDAEANGVVIGREARSLGIDVVLQPFINIDRDIAFDRSYNTFGEDPLLTGAIGAAEIRGIQSQDVMAQAKHYLAFDSNRRAVSESRAHAPAMNDEYKDASPK